MLYFHKKRLQILKSFFMIYFIFCGVSRRIAIDTPDAAAL